MRILGTLVAIALWLGLSSSAAADTLAVPPSLAAEALSEQTPSAFAPAPLDIQDFAVTRVDGDEGKAHVWLDPGSVRWVRVAGWAVVPRALLVVRAPGASGGVVMHGGFSHPLAPIAGGGQAFVPVVLLSSEEPVVELDVVRGTQHSRARYRIQFRPRAANEGHVSTAVDCSPYGVKVARGGIPADSWLHVSCRMVSSARARERAATLELYLTWDQAGPQVTANGALVRPRAAAFYTLRVSKGPGTVRLEARGSELELAYFLPPELHAAFVGAGVGPYYYHFRRPESDLKTAVPMITVYGGYSFTPKARVVYFNATAVHSRGFSDQGLYLWLEQTRFLDERVSVNLLLGANLLIYHRVHKWVPRINGPQGVELIYRDFLGRAKNLTVGGFLYPEIAGSAYYNGWLRWGSMRFFGEVNFLYWREPYHSGPTESTSVGLTFGMPLARFL